MRKTFFIISFFLMSLILAGCTSNLSEGNSKSNGSEFVMGSDHQAECKFGVAYTENGRYFTEFISNPTELYDAWILYYEDFGGDAVPVCNKANCNHDNEECNAYFSTENYKRTTNNFIWYYKDSLYVYVARDGYSAIEKIKKDGSSREESCVLYRAMASEEVEDDVVINNSYYPEVMIHRGYAYFSNYYPGCKECGIYRVKLDSSEKAQKLASVDGKSPMLYRIKGYGDSVYYQKGDFSSTDYSATGISLYCWNEKDGEQVVAPEIVSFYSVGKSMVYYYDIVNMDSLMGLDTNTKQTTLFFDSGGVEGGMYDIFFEKEDRVYLIREEKQYVYDLSGELVDTLTGPDIIYPYVVNGE